LLERDSTKQAVLARQLGGDYLQKTLQLLCWG